MLSQIAASGKDGVLQGELRRATGQDKRSVPKRTDALRDKGYITKATVYVKGTKTSHLTLQRYATQYKGDGSVSEVAGALEGPAATRPVTVRSLVNKLENFLVNETRLELDDIARLLDFRAHTQRKVLARVLRCMERAGCLKRVKMALAPNAQAGDLKTYFQSRRPVADNDKDVFDKHSIPFSKIVAEVVLEEAAKSPPATPEAGDGGVEPTQAILQWNPDRSVANMISDAVRRAGSSGLSLVDLRDLITGPLVRRPLESLLARLSYQSWSNQPRHLRHLAIVRASNLVEGSLDYGYFSLEALLKAAKAKTAQLASIPGARRSLDASMQAQVTYLENEPSSEPDIDDFGFLINRRARSIVGKHAASPPEQDEAVAVSDSVPQAGGSTIVDDIHEEEVLRSATSRRMSSKMRTPKKPRPVVPNAQTPERPLGRPRKFLRGTEKFWQYHLWQARLEAHKSDDELPPREGTMRDPAAQALFRSRPEDFDETIVDAKAAGLPLPSINADISEDWVRRTKMILHRGRKGAYVTPAGSYTNGTRNISQLLIVRSNRLKEVDFSAKKRTAAYRFISSSAAHSFPNLAYAPGSPKGSKAARKQTKKVKRDVKQASKKIPEKTVKQGPRLGVFVEATTSAQTGIPQEHPQEQPPAKISAIEYQQVMDETEADSGVDDQPTSHDTPASRRSSRTSFTTSVAGYGSARRKLRTQSVHSLASTAASAAAVRTRPSRQRKLTQKAAESLEEGIVGVISRLSTPPMYNASGTTYDQQDLAAESEPDVEPDDAQDTTTAVKGVGDDDNLEAALDSIRVPDLTPVSLDPPTAPAQQGNFHKDMIPPEAVGTENKENERSAFGTEMSPLAPTSQEQSQERNVTDFDLEGDNVEAPGTKRRKSAAPGQREKPKLCRKIIVDLVMLASGAAPGDASTIKRVMINRWQVAGGHDRPPLKLVKNNLRVLSESSKLRLITVSFGGKGGIHRRKTILAHPNIDPNSQLIQALKKQIIEADPSDYVPPEWQAETLPTLNLSGNKRGRDKDAEAENPPIQEVPLLFSDQDDLLQEDEDEQETPQTPVSESPRRRSTTTGGESSTSLKGGVQSGQAIQSTEVPTPTRKVVSSTTAAFLTLKLKKEKKATSAFKVIRSSNAGLLTLKVPRLGELPQVQDSIANIEDPGWGLNIEQVSEESESQGATPLCLPAVPIRFNPEVTFQTGTALPTPAAKRRSGLRKKTKRKYFDAIPDETISERPRPALSKSLKSLSAIIEFENATHKIERLGPEAGEARFLMECEVVAAWETHCQHAIQATASKWTFINHSAPDQPRASSIAYWLLVDASLSGLLTEKPSFENESWAPFVAAIQTTVSQIAASSSASVQSDRREGVAARAISAQATGKEAGIRRKRKLLDAVDFVAPSPKRPKRKHVPTSKAKAAVSLQEDALAEHISISPQIRRKRRFSDALDFIPTTPKRTKRRHVPTSKAKSTFSQEHDGSAEDVIASPQKVIKIRNTEASNHLKKLSADDVYRLTTTVIAVRVLSGGVDRHIDWSIVKSLQPNEEDERLLEECWSTHLAKHRADIRTLTESFQEKYIGALERGETPGVNFDDLQSTDWKGIVSWAVNVLHPATTATTSKKALDLPAMRSEFLSQHKLSRSDAPSLRSIFHPSQKTKLSEQEDLHRATVFGIGLRPPPPPDQGSASADTASRLRSLWLSLIICPEDLYSDAPGDAKFYSIGPTENDAEVLIRPIHEQLQQDNLITERPGAQKVQGPRRWQVTSKFYEQFNEKNCLITATMLKKAAKYKLTVLDEAFARKETVETPKSSRAEAGEMLAITQLLGNGMIKVRPGADIPSSRYGVDWQRVGYQTNSLEKAQFGFGVVLAGRDGYVVGDVVGKRAAVEPPSSDKNDLKATPVWVDVHGQVVEEIWEMVLGAAIGLVSMRPGVNAEEISKSLGNAVGAWEVELVLTWAEQAGSAKKTRSGSGWETKEWWWLCLGTGADDADEL